MGELEHLLQLVKSGDLEISEARRLIIARTEADGPAAWTPATFTLQNQPTGFQEERIANLGYAQLDLDRDKRTGFPEVIFGEGKTAEQITAILGRLMQHADRVVATRISPEKAAII